MPIYGQALVTIPTKERVGVFPTLCVLAVGTLVFCLSFQTYFQNFGLITNYMSYFPTDVLDTLIALSLPASIMFAFVTSQVRIRLNLHIINLWSIFHSILFITQLVQAIIYTLARPEGVFSFMGSVSMGSSLESVIKFFKKISESNTSLIKAYSDKTSKQYAVSMYFASFSFIAQFLFVVIFTTMACSLYGETKAVVTICDDKNKVLVDVAYKRPKVFKGGKQAK
ncbi:Transmembrane_domain-containing protein [Hexamita inflata]|uniref:Transmembrane domain-containing protein n=1 Tax=Hexamita inflata TaxID=28002 RepID=A0AA86UJ90_9EUKA|nr:Transmembrane domain-containing protein [Hexamita inflata]CAI9942103.1 Transmembrane domain-containing protein [Hexamita inflata]CAI9974472.1 Transmembrane domain-containing protein [Hexamita inflata]